MEDKEIRYLAKLAHISLTEEEIARLKRDLGKILEYVGQLNTLATKEVVPAFTTSPHPGGEPAGTTLPSETSLREDTVIPSLPRDAILENTPESADGFVRVPRVLRKNE